jgi:transposase-like protein
MKLKACPFVIHKMEPNNQMIKILEKVGLTLGQINLFIEQKISPDIVPCLSLYEFQCLGVRDRSEIMKLRMECVIYRRTNFEERQSKFDIPKQMISGLLESGFSITDASKMLSVSESTLYRKMRHYSISKRNFTEISDTQLDGIVTEMLEEFPHSGEAMLWKLLYEKGIKVIKEFVLV